MDNIIERGGDVEQIGDSTSMAQWLNMTFGSSSIGWKAALEQAAFLLCVDVIAQDVAKATLRLKERISPKTSRIVMYDQHPIAGLLADEPNQRHTWYEFCEMLGLWGAITQNTYAYVIRNRVGDPMELIPLVPSQVMEPRVSGRSIYYDIVARTEHERALLGGTFVTAHERDMIHIRGRLLDGLTGYSTMIVGRKTLQTASQIEDYRSNLFGEDGQLRGVFTKPDGAMSEPAFIRLREQMRALMNNVRARNDPIVLEEGVKFEKISSNPKEAELTLQFEAQINQTIRLLRVPPHKVFQLDTVKYENLETMEKAYVGDTLIPICRRFEERYKKVLLQGADRQRFFFEHDRDEMSIRDTKAHTERVVKAAERGIIDLDEARAELGYNEYPGGGGKVRIIPANAYLVDENNVAILGPQAGQKSTDTDEDSDGDQEAAEKAVLRLVHERG